MNIPPTLELQQIAGAKQEDKVNRLTQTLIRFWGLLAKVVNNGIEMYSVDKNGNLVAGNVRGYIWSGSLSIGNNTIVHNLGYVPIGFINLSANGLTNMWTVSATTTNIVIRSSGAVSAKVLII